jgi:hypothetical protein
VITCAAQQGTLTATDYTNINASIALKLNITDQRYNDTVAINALNATIQSLNTSTNAAYAGVYNINATTLTLTTQSVWYNMTSWTAGDLAGGWTYNSTRSALICGTAGEYFVTYVFNNQLNAGDNVKYQLLVNGVAEPKSAAQQKYTFGNSQNVVMVLHKRLSAGDAIVAQVQEMDASSKVLTNINSNINMQRIGP